MSVFEELSFAITNRRVVSFNYDGLRREVEPFLLGETTAGNLALRGYQTGGSSRSGRVPGWHLFSLSKIDSITVEQFEFEGARPFYNPSDTAMRRIYARV